MIVLPHFLRDLSPAELELALVQPDGNLDPLAFTFSTQGSAIRVGMAMPLEHHFPRAIEVTLGKTAHSPSERGHLTLTLVPSTMGKYALGRTYVDARQKYGGWRMVQFPKTEVYMIGISLQDVPQIREAPVSKAILTRDGRYLLTTDLELLR